MLARAAAFIRRQPLRTMLWILIAWVSLACLNLVLRERSIIFDTPTWFPLSVFSGPTFHLLGLPYVALFLVIVFASRRHLANLRAHHMFLLGLALIVLGNLGQGDFAAGFVRPFEDSGYQYFHDAIRIDSWTQWLRQFNDVQPDLLNHSRVHPPFAVLLHYATWRGLGESTSAMAVLFTLIAALAIVLVGRTCTVLGFSTEEAKTRALLLSVVPAVNIYSAVSLDGVILATASLFLLGVVMVEREPAGLAAGAGATIVGLILTNLLTYGGVFLLAVGGLLALRAVVFGRGMRLAGVMAAGLASLVVIMVVLHQAYGYDHIQGFLMTARLENPGGFWGFAHPAQYVMTRLESVGEVALFLSLGLLATLLSRRWRPWSRAEWKDDVFAIGMAGVLVLGAMFLTGAFQMGETGRACLFIHPYLILLLGRAGQETTRDLIVMAGIQTAGMQLFGGYFW